MEKLISFALKLSTIILIFIISNTLNAQNSLFTQDFESYNIGDQISHIGWAPTDIESMVSDDPVSTGNKVLKNIVHNYNAAPVLKFVIPSGTTLSDYGTFAFKGYFAQGDVAYKDILVEVYQTIPTGQFSNNTDAVIGSFSRALGGSTDWENIEINIEDSSGFVDTVYVAFGINCAGTGDVGAPGDTTIWYADDIELIAKVDTTTPIVQILTNGDFESSEVGTVESTDVQGWLIQVADGVSPVPEFEIVSDNVQQGTRALKVVLNSAGANQWDIQIVADSINIEPGKLYDYSIWAKAENSGAQVNFTVGNYSFSEYTAIRPAALTTEWKQFTAQFTVTDNQTVIRAPIHFGYASNIGIPIYIDNLQITKYEPTDTGTVWNGPAFATGQAKFIGSSVGAGDPNFTNFWNQVTPENAGKFGTVAVSEDTSEWNWTGLDYAYNLAKDNDLLFKHHTLIWGQQQPSWITTLDSAQQAEAIEQWIKMVGERYPLMDMVDVVNEPLPGHAPAPYAPALGGSGETGWDWIIWSFQKAREYLPNTKLILNEYNVINSNTNTNQYLEIINLLNDRGLIDGIGVQGHRFELESTDVNTLKSNLDKLAATGLPIYISEFDLGNLNNAGTPDDDQQLNLYKKIFPILWKHPGVKGITFWGYVENQIWQETCFLVRSDGSVRPALLWLAQYVKDNPTDVKEINISNLPNDFSLDQNYPNPFNPSTTIRFSLRENSKVNLKIYNILGQQVATLINNKNMNAGSYNYNFDALNFTSGVYIYRIEAGSFTSAKKMILLK